MSWAPDSCYASYAETDKMQTQSNRSKQGPVLLAFAFPDSSLDGPWLYPLRLEALLHPTPPTQNFWIQYPLLQFCFTPGPLTWFALSSRSSPLTPICPVL